MKKKIIVWLSLMLGLSFLLCAAAEEKPDYSWLDDLTINQLKELDSEIHKRIPYEGVPANKPSLEGIIGEWICEYNEQDFFKNNPTNHRRRTTYVFQDGYTGEVSTYDLDEDHITASGPFSYELADSDTILITVSGLVTSTSSMTLEEIDGEIVLKEGTGRIFTKKAEDKPKP